MVGHGRTRTNQLILVFIILNQMNSLHDIFLNALHFDDDQGLLKRTCDLFSQKFHENQIRYFIIGGYALIKHGYIRNTMDVDVMVHEEDFQAAVKILRDVGFNQTIGDTICAKFHHEHLLPVDVLSAPIYGPYPCDKNRIEINGVYFCDLPTLVYLKTKGYVGRPITESMLLKKMKDEVDLLSLILTHSLNEDYGKTNNFDFVIENVYRKIHTDYYDNFKPLKEKKKSNCICQ